MLGKVLGVAHDPRRGLCWVQHLRNEHFILTPQDASKDRVVRHRSEIRWRRATPARTGAQTE